MAVNTQAVTAEQCFGRKGALGAGLVTGWLDVYLRVSKLMAHHMGDISSSSTWKNKIMSRMDSFHSYSFSHNLSVDFLWIQSGF